MKNLENQGGKDTTITLSINFQIQNIKLFFLKNLFIYLKRKEKKRKGARQDFMPSIKKKKKVGERGQGSGGGAWVAHSIRPPTLLDLSSGLNCVGLDYGCGAY